MMWKLALFLVVVLWVHVESQTVNTTISNLKECTHTFCDFSHVWNLMALLNGNQTYIFTEHNASLTIFNANWRAVVDLDYYAPIVVPRLVQESLFVNPKESICLNEAGVDLTIMCENPSELPSIRESGMYCNNPKVLPSFHVYLATIEIQWFMEVNYTVEMEAGTVTNQYRCDTLNPICELVSGFELPLMGHVFPAFDVYLQILGDFNFSDLAFVVPSEAVLYPYTPFPEDLFVVRRPLVPEYRDNYPKPDCHLWEGEYAYLNTTADPFPEDIRLSLVHDFGAIPESLKLTMDLTSPLTIDFNLSRPGAQMWFESFAYLPFRNDTRFTPA